MRSLWNKLFKNIAEDTSKIKIRPYIETDHESGSKDGIDESRRNFFRNSLGVGVGVIAQQQIPVKELEPVKDPLVEQLTKRIEELEAAQNMMPVYGSQLNNYSMSLSTAFCSFSDVPYTISRNPSNMRKM